MIANYHTHTRWCRHGSGEIEDYILEGIEKGLEILAITEHVPLEGDPDPFRLTCAEFDAFNGELDRMIQRYSGRIAVLKGFECEYFPDQLARYRRFGRNSAIRSSSWDTTPAATARWTTSP